MFKFSLGSFSAFPVFDDLVSTFDLPGKYLGIFLLLSWYVTGILLTSKWPSRASRPLGLLFRFSTTYLEREWLIVEWNGPKIWASVVHVILNVYKILLAVNCSSAGSFGVFPIFLIVHNLVSQKRRVLGRNEPKLGPLELVLTLYRVLLIYKCSRSIWGHSVHFGFSTAWYLENGLLLNKRHFREASQHCIKFSPYDYSLWCAKKKQKRKTLYVEYFDLIKCFR